MAPKVYNNKSCREDGVGAQKHKTVIALSNVM